MSRSYLSRRDYLKIMGSAGLMAGAGIAATTPPVASASQAQEPEGESAEVKADRDRRMKWWREARFGMFVHWGTYSVLGRHEWAMEMEGIPWSEYAPLAQQFKPRPNAAREWARLARRAGMKYMVMTTKHCEGFCNFDTKLTDYCAPKQGPGRDLVQEYVEAARAEGLRVGFYYCLMDWRHPDGARCAEDEDARRRFIEYGHGQIRELCSNYGKIDILWYDTPWPLDAERWESERMNEMVFGLQPDIVVNNRNGLVGDFRTPEQKINRHPEEGYWETCMTMNDSWGYMYSDDNWKRPETIVRNLLTCANGGGNYLLNIGPKADGSVPEESVRILNKVGEWMDKHGEAVYGTERCRVLGSTFARFSRKGNTLYVHAHHWPGETVSVGGLQTRVRSAKLLATGEGVAFEQDAYGVRFTGLPATSPDDMITTIAAECEAEPVQDTVEVRKTRPRPSVA
jgi:alpha-L-fucosidase